MNNRQSNYFYFTKNERIGILFICLLSFITLILPGFIGNNTFYSSEAEYAHEEISSNKAIGKLEQKFNRSKKQERIYEENQSKLGSKIEINSASLKQLMALGISPKTAYIIIKYRDKGGQFKNRESFKKIFGISEKDYDTLSANTVFSSDEKEDNHLSPVNFDPNTVTPDELSKMGLPTRIIQTIANFREKGGKFYNKEDLSKIYGLKQEWFDELLPYIQIQILEKPTTQFNFLRSAGQKSFSKSPEIININTANIQELDKIKGVGPGIAARIIKFRDALGGFASKEQMSEVRNLPDTVLQSILLAVEVKGDHFRIKINQAEKQDFYKHPYINGSQATILINYRIQHGSFRGIGDVVRTKAFSDVELKKISAYFDFSE